MPTTCPHCGIRVRPSATRCPQCDGTLFEDTATGGSAWTLSEDGGVPDAPPAWETGGSRTGADQPPPGDSGPSAGWDPAGQGFGGQAGAWGAGSPGFDGPGTSGPGMGGWGPSGAGPLTSSERDLGMLAHLSAFVTFIGIPSFVGPLVVWLWKRDQHPFIAEHAREALNFNLSVLLYGIAAFVLAVVTLGLALLVLIPVGLALVVAFFVLTVIAAQRASKGELYRYPLTIRFLT